LTKSQDALKQATQEMADAKSEREKAVATAAMQIKRADELSDKLTKTTQERDDSQTNWPLTRPRHHFGSSRQTQPYAERAQEAVEIANEEKIVLLHTVTRLTNQLAKVMGTTEYIVKLRADLRGKILVVDPKWILSS